MKKQLLTVMLCGALLTGCDTASVPHTNGSGTSAGSFVEQPTVARVDLDDFIIGGCTSLSLAGNLAAAKAGDTSYETACDKTAFSGNSEAAWQNLLDGKLDVVFAYVPSAEIKQKLDEQGISLIEVGTDALVFLAGTNPKAYQTPVWTKQNILAAYEKDNTSAWIGYAAASGSDSRELFATVFGTDASGVTIQSGEDTLTAACPHTAGTLCYTTWLSLLQNGKPDNTKIADIDGILPTETQKGISYPFTVSYYVAVRSDLENNDPAMLFYRWISSDAGQEWLSEATVLQTAEETDESNDMTQAS